MKVNLVKLKKLFSIEYKRIYDTEVAGVFVYGYYEAMEYGERLIHECKDLVCAFAQYRGDVLSSDREVAAFGFAVNRMLFNTEFGNTTSYVSGAWCKYDQDVARCQLNNYGKIFLDEYGKPIDDEYELEELAAKTAR